MNYPNNLNKEQSYHGFVQAFKGLNRNIRINDDENASERNLSADNYPLLSTRAPRSNTAINNANLLTRANVLTADGVIDTFVVKTNNSIKFVNANNTEIRTEVPVTNVSDIITQAGKMYLFPEASKLELLTINSSKTSLEEKIVVTKGVDTASGFPEEPDETITASGVDTAHGNNRLTIITRTITSKYQYGTYVLFNPNTNIVRSIKYVGLYDKADVPLITSNQHALFGHGEYSTWTKNIAVGDKITADTSTLLVSLYKKASNPTLEFIMTPSDADGRSVQSGIKAERYFNKINAARSTNDLVIYTSAYGTTTGTNVYGTEAVVDSNGVVTSIRKYGQGSATIGSGFVVSGHGTASDWIQNNISEGNFITYNESTKYIAVYETANNVVATKKPTNAANGMRWYDDVTDQMYIYSEATGVWAALTSNYIALTMKTKAISSGGQSIEPNYTITENGTATDIWCGSFKEGDAVKISGLSEDYDKTYVIEKVLDNALVLEGFIAKETEFTIAESAEVVINREVPKMDYVIESNNRIWGCRYGKGADGKVLNEIYCSAQGSPENFYRYQNISTDSWTATVGTDGDFTGAIVYKGYPIFFKEDAMIIVYGSSPSTYQLITYNYKGVKKGCSKSLVIVDEVLYYYSTDGFVYVRKIGGVPAKLDDDLNTTFSEVICGAAKDKMYASCINGNETELFTYDTKYKIWHKEDSKRIIDFCRVNDLLYMVDSNHNVLINDKGNESFTWEMTTGVQGIDVPNHKYLKSIDMRMIIPYGTNVSIYIIYDDEEPVMLKTITGMGTIPVSIKLMTKRCDRHQLKIAGEGAAKIISIYKEYEKS